MIGLSWIFGLTLFLTLEQNTIALPALVNTEHLRSGYIIEGKSVPPCIRHICPYGTTGGIRAVVPVPGKETITNDKSKNTDDGSSDYGIKASDDLTHDKPNLKVDCSDDLESLGNANYKNQDSITHPIKKNQLKKKFKITGDNQTIVPDNCKNEKVKCLLNEEKDFNLTKKINISTICINNQTIKRPITHQTAPITCGDGTKPPCGNNNKNNNSDFHLPPTHQTAPITCGDGTKPPCH